MMSKCNWLSFLKVSKARHEGIKVCFHNGEQFFKESFQKTISLINLISCVKLHVKCNLIISASACMKLLSSLSDTFNQMSFYEAVNIFTSVIEFKCATVDIRKNTS